MFLLEGNYGKSNRTQNRTLTKLAVSKGSHNKGGFLASPRPNPRYQGTFRCSKFTLGKVGLALRYSCRSC